MGKAYQLRTAKNASRSNDVLLKYLAEHPESTKLTKKLAKKELYFREFLIRTK